MAAVSEHDLGLPKNVIKRIVKEKLAGAEGGKKPELQINKEALLAFGESAKVCARLVARGWCCCCCCCCYWW
jgi:histone H3/H4